MGMNTDCPSYKECPHRRDSGSCSGCGLENDHVFGCWFDKGSLSARCSNCGCKSTTFGSRCSVCNARMVDCL